MTKAWHISDVHLSFDHNYIVQKDMSQRSWTKGAWTYTGYLDKMADFGTNIIKPMDYVFVTGDVVHDMKEHQVVHSIRWLRENINGTIVICRGNHDKLWEVRNMRRKISNLQDVYLIDEGEIFTVGPYTIGCYSNHSNKTNNFDAHDADYIVYAQLLALQANRKGTTPVMMSHYPVNVNMAEQIGEAGVKAYLSGHIHCTKADDTEAIDGIDMKWYNELAARTDDKEINGCYFSTGTTDVVLVRHKQSFKELKCIEEHTVPHQELNAYRSAAQHVFGCSNNFIGKFDKEDPFNKGNEIAGFICRKKGDMQGSLLITHVNGQLIEPQIVYGTPKLAYPYKNTSSTDFIKFPKCTEAVFTEKWNGMNVLFYKYYDAQGKEYVTAKSKGTAIISDTEVGNFLSLTKEVLSQQSSWQDFIKEYMTDGATAVSFELCGTKEPHLVKYDFDIKLHPLFKMYPNGDISPITISHSESLFDTSSDSIKEKCIASQKNDYQKNISYRTANNLPHKYEYEHFAVEGKVLYLLDDNGILIDRTMYKIKPKDVEEVHWQTFGSTMQGRVNEAVSKIKANGAQVCAENIQQELDMGPKEWNKFGKAIIEYVRSGKEKTAEVLILCGLPGCGKSSVARIIEKQHAYVRVNQDEVGSRNACKKMMDDALKANKSVVVDRCNFDVRQRKSWIDLAANNGITNVRIVHIDVPIDVCIERAGKRTDHPTIHDVNIAEKVITSMQNSWVEPTQEEGAHQVLYIKRPASADAVAKQIMENK